MANAYGTTTHMTTAVSHAEYISRHLDTYLADTLEGTVRYEPTKNQLVDIINNTLHSLVTALRAADACQLNIRPTIEPMLVDVYQALQVDRSLVDELDATSRSALSVRLTDMLYSAACTSSQLASTVSQPSIYTEAQHVHAQDEKLVDTIDTVAECRDDAESPSARGVSAETHDAVVEEHHVAAAKASTDAAKSTSKFAQLARVTHDLNQNGLTPKHKYELIHRIDAAFAKDYSLLPQPISELVGQLSRWFHARYIDYGTGSQFQGYNINEVFMNIACMCGSYGKCYDEYQESKFDSSIRYYLESCQKLSAAGKKVYDLTTDAKAIKNGCFYANPCETNYAVANHLSSRSIFFTNFVFSYILRDVMAWIISTPWATAPLEWTSTSAGDYFFEDYANSLAARDVVAFGSDIPNAEAAGMVCGQYMISETLGVLNTVLDRTCPIHSGAVTSQIRKLREAGREKRQQWGKQVGPYTYVDTVFVDCGE